MTAHRAKPTLTPERIEWFTRYYLAEPAWGVFHVSLDDGNYDCGAAEHDQRAGTGERVNGVYVPARWDFGRDEWPADLREAAEWFETLTPSQRRRLGRRAEESERQMWAQRAKAPDSVTLVVQREPHTNSDGGPT